MQQQQNENKHISRRKHARRRRAKHGGQGGGESRHCARVRETRQLRIVGPKELRASRCAFVGAQRCQTTVARGARRAAAPAEIGLGAAPYGGYAAPTPI